MNWHWELLVFKVLGILWIDFFKSLQSHKMVSKDGPFQATVTSINNILIIKVMTWKWIKVQTVQKIFIISVECYLPMVSFLFWAETVQMFTRSHPIWLVYLLWLTFLIYVIPVKQDLYKPMMLYSNIFLQSAFLETQT